MREEINKADLSTSINDMLKRSFNINTFNDSFDTLNKIAEKYKDNPEQLGMEADAYIDGTLSSIDGDTKEVYNILKTQRDGLVDQSYRNFTKNQIQDAENNINQGLYKSGKIAIDSYKKKLPEKIQVLESANYLKNIQDAKEKGSISPSQAVNLTSDFARDIIINNLGDILRDPAVSVEEKQSWVYKMIDGQTGEMAVDDASPYVRMQAVQSVLSANKQLDDYEKHIKDKIDSDETNFWQDRELALRNYVVNGGDKETIDAMVAYQRMTAKTLQQFEEAGDIYKAVDRKTDPRVKYMVDNALNSVDLTKQEKLDLVYASEQSLSFDDMTEYINRINSPVSRLMERQDIKEAQSRAVAFYGYNPMGQNNAYDYFNYLLRSKLSTAQTNEDIQKAINDSFNETDKMYKERTDAGRVEQKRNFVNSYDVAPEQIELMITTRIRELDPKANKSESRRQAVQPQAEADIANRIAQEKGISINDAAIIIQKAKRINQTGVQ